MKNNYYLLALFLILGGIYWKWFTTGPRVALDFPLISDITLKSFLDIPRIWFEIGGEGLGQYGVFTLWSYPASLVSAFLANLGFSFEIIERLFFLIPFLILGSLSINKIGDYLKFSNSAKFVSTLFYLTNTYILLVIDGGQLLISLAYAWFPFSFLMVEKSIDGNLKRKLIAALSITALGFFDVRFIFVLFLLLLIRFLFGFIILGYHDWFAWIKKWISVGILSFIIFIALNSYWIIAQIFSPLSNDIFSKLTQTSSTSLINLAHPLLLISPHWFKNIFGVISPIRYEFILIPILVYISPILRFKDKMVAFWLIVSLIGIFLSKGNSEPMGEIYQWLFNNVSGFALFRDSTKFFFLVGLSYAILLGITVDWLINRVGRSIRVKFIFLSALTTYLFFLSTPAWQGLMSGTLSDQSYQKEYQEIGNLLENDQNFARVFWIPSSQPLTFSDPNHPIVEALRFVDKRPFSSAILGTYEVFNFLREASYMGELFDVSAIGYIVYPYLDSKRDNLHPDNIKYYYTFLDQLSNLSWLSRIDDLSMPTFKVNKHQGKFFVTDNTWIILGSDDIYNEATKSANLSLANNAFIFADENIGFDYDLLPSANIVLYKKEVLDLIANFFNQDQIIFPAKQLNLSPDTSGWWKRDGPDIINWRYFLKTKYGIDNKDFDLGGGWAIAEGNLTLRIEDERISKDKILFVRVLESSKSGNLSFHQGNSLVGEINTSSPQTNMRWFRVGQVESDQEITLKAEGGINVVNALALVDKNQFREYEEKMTGYRSRIKDFNAQNTKEGEVSVEYQKINTTDYEIKVKGLKEPSILVFSENFDSGWRLNGQKSFRIYNLLNGFTVEKDGVYWLTFEPQRYILPGLIITMLAGILISILIWRI